MRREYSAYIVRCSDGSYYTGVTNDVDRRLKEHAIGLNENSYTSQHKPKELMFIREFKYVEDAIHFEKVVKAWSRKKKEALITGDEKALRMYSRKRFPKKFKRECNARIRNRRLLTRSLVRSLYEIRCANFYSE